jgi:hypothetical protein
MRKQSTLRSIKQLQSFLAFHQEITKLTWLKINSLGWTYQWCSFVTTQRILRLLTNWFNIIESSILNLTWTTSKTISTLVWLKFLLLKVWIIMIHVVTSDTFHSSLSKLGMCYINFLLLKVWIIMIHVVTSDTFHSSLSKLGMCYINAPTWGGEITNIRCIQLSIS